MFGGMFKVGDLVTAILSHIPTRRRTILNISEVSKFHRDLVHRKMFWQAIGYHLYDDSIVSLSGDHIKSMLTGTQLRDELEKVTFDLMSDDRKWHSLAAKHIRRMMTYPYEAHPYREIIDAGLVDRLLELSVMDDESLQVDCLWTLQNLSAEGSANFSLAIGTSYLFPELVHLLPMKGDVGETACWVLGNVLGDYFEHGRVYNAGLLRVLATELANAGNLPLDKVRAISTLLGTLCDHPSINDRFAPLLPDIVNLLPIGDNEVSSNCRYALAQLTLKTDAFNYSTALMDTVELATTMIEYGAFSALGNMLVAANGEQILRLIDAGLLKLMKDRIEAGKKEKAVVWMLANMATESVTLSKIMESGIMPIVDDLYDGANPPTQKEVEHFMVTAARNGSVETHYYFIDHGMLRVLMGAIEHWEDIESPLGALISIGDDCEAVESDALWELMRTKFPKGKSRVLLDLFGTSKEELARSAIEHIL